MFFKEGNTARKKNYQTPEELESKVDEYFKECEETKKPPTMSGLAFFLGFSDRASIIKYAKEPGYEEYFPVMQQAKLRVEKFTEERLISDASVIGKIFSLKNNFNSWADKQEIETSSKDSLSNVDFSKLSTEEKGTLLTLLKKAKDE